MKFTERSKRVTAQPKRQTLNISSSFRGVSELFNKFDFKRFFAKLVIILLFLFVVLIVTLNNTYSESIYKEKDKLPTSQYAIVFGSGITEDGEASIILKDRILAAVDLYKAGKVQVILISGESRYENYNETAVMKELLLAYKIPAYAIEEDGESGRTFDTCIRAKKVFNINQAVLITQEFHLTRALYICNSLGIESIGFAADRRLYEQLRLYYLRESLAMAKALLDLYYINPYNYNSLVK